MKQTLRIAIPIIVLMGVIFAVTFFAQYTPRTDEPIDGPTSLTEVPLRFFSSSRSWNPFGDLQSRAFPGFYEVHANEAGPPNGASFWFENRNEKPVTMRLKGVSCTACSGGRVAALPSDATRDLLQMTAISALPGGLFSGFPLGMAGPVAFLDERRLNWQGFEFRNNPNAEYRIPAAANADGWTPQWGILELRFTVGALGPKTLSSEFELNVDGTKEITSARFDINFEGVEPFNVSRTEIDVGELSETSEPASYELLVYSSTRGPGLRSLGDLEVPAISVQLPGGSPGVPGPFVSVSTPERIPDAELAEIPNQIKMPVRVEAAYRMVVTVRPKVGKEVIDIGPLERDIHISAANMRHTVRVKGTVRGGVWLDDNQKGMTLNYRFSAGTTGVPFTLVSDRPETELAIVADPATPDFLQLALEKLPAAGDRGRYRLKATVAPGKGPAGPWTGFVVIDAKGPKPQRIRIPVRGNAQR